MTDSLAITITTFIVATVINLICWRRGKFQDMDRKLFAGSSIFTLLFLIQVSPLELVKAPYLSSIPPAITGILYLVLIGPNIWLCIYTLFKRITEGDGKEKNKSFFHPLLCKAAVLVESIFFTFSAIPALFVYGDIMSVVNLVNADKWDAWHTIGYVWFVELCSRIYPAPFSVIIVQSILWVLLNFYIIDMLNKVLPRAVSFYTIIMCGLFTPALYLESMTKDVVFAIGTLAVTAVAFKVIRTNKVNFLDILVWATLPLFTILCRHGGFVPVFIVDFAIVLRMLFIKNKNVVIKTLGVFVVHLLALIVVNVILTSALNVIPNPDCVKYGTPMAAIGAAAKAGVEFSPEDKATLEKLMPIEEWANCYTPYLADDMSRPWGNLGDRYFAFRDLVDNEDFGSDLIKINAKLFAQHPIIYARAIFDMNSILWRYGLPDGTGSMALCEVDHAVEISYTFFYRFTRNVTVPLDHNPVTRAICTRGGVATFILLFSCFVTLTQKKKRYEIIPLIPIVVIMLLLAITIPAQDTRYVLPAIEVAAFYLSIMLAGGFKKGQDNG